MNDSVIHKARQENLRALRQIVENMGKNVDLDYFEMALEKQAQGQLEAWIIEADGEIAGFCFLNWTPKYGLFQKLNIPEIQDLNIAPKFRRRGLATALIAHCEKSAADAGYEQMGLGVGLNSSYGAAQRLYVLKGYVPDGNGVCYDRGLVASGDVRPLDDDLCLMMVKNLAKTAA